MHASVCALRSPVPGRGECQNADCGAGGLSPDGPVL
jgi:hypothetical protein